jgi:hypothetical protein
MVWRKWCQRPRAERAALLALSARAFVDLTLFWITNRLDRRLRLSRRLLARAIRPAPQPIPDITIDVVTVCARWHPLRPQCLETALARAARLERGGMPARVVIGVRTTSPFDSHAWHEAVGEQLTASPAYHVLAVIDPREDAGGGLTPTKA